MKYKFPNTFFVIMQTTFKLILTFYNLAVSLCTTRFNARKFYMVLTLHRVFCVDLRTEAAFALHVIN